ncbi:MULTISPECIES: alpha/beta hydrolase [Streptomyces]|uniref:2-hydroxy-6-oxo-6-phenylhexa-2,4-dienoate hydrolase n=1 Tax=Streptomyces sviceus (strain ATCC 29083 / DSM 924 / JCM 4929 / NBRC 13980 / NCIMB 11184 / NRRL 5439 / UC 5370) TaxID=463191 RepID=B5HZJ3_STRX2|nr:MULTISPECIES: alpha/beta hydrolase [Streptomyces]EDY58248.1 2-hydroxy-6-oxo-6-phenylhexa-2,4-dienoate hydrolase [Streptomyces sviceus ATCC 29083]MYT04316.1 alpha/beta fold hydrolase [Streptomyces sp. SID5470]
MSIWSEPQPDSRFVVVDGLQIHYKRAGRGPTLVLLHGSASSLQHFDRVAALLSESFDVIRPDLPGCGLTGPRTDRDYRVPAYAATGADFLETLGVPRYAVAGNSLGGNIAWNLALDHPERVTGLVLVNATGYPEKEVPAGIRLARNPLLRPLLRRVMPRGAIERNLRAHVGPHSTIVDDAMVDRAHQLMNRPGNRSAFVDFCNTDQPDRSAQIPSITTPTLVLRSAGVDGQHFTRDIPGAQELVHPHSGHLLPEEEPQWVSDAIAQFLRSSTDTPTH